MRRVEFHRFLNEDNALRVEFELEHGRVLKFVVQLECRFVDAGELEPVVRYDTAHGFAHCDRLHPYGGSIKDRILVQDCREALTFAIEDLVTNWTIYRRRYQEWLNQK
jgi:hypothetical protein